MSLGDAAQIEAGLQGRPQCHQGADFVLFGNSIGLQIDPVLRVGTRDVHAQMVTGRRLEVGKIHHHLRLYQRDRTGIDFDIAGHQVAVAWLGCIGVIEVEADGSGLCAARGDQHNREYK